MEAGQFVQDVGELGKGILGVWQSAGLERAPKEDGRITYRRRVFDIQPDHFSLLIDVFADAAAEHKVFTLEFWGPYHIGERSKIVHEAFESEWAHWRWWIAPHSLLFLEDVLKKDPRTASYNWQIGVPQDVSEHGAIDVLSIREGRQEYDIIALSQDASRLFFGERGFRPPARPDQRHTKLSTDAFVRSSISYSKHRDASIHWDSSVLRTIAVVGMGDVGATLGRLFARHGHKVLFGSREPHSEKSKAVAAAAPGTSVVTVQEAVKAASVVVLALPGHVVVDTAKELDLRGKVVLDVTNPIGQGLLLTMGTTTSAGEAVAAVASGAHVIKCFNTIGYNHFEYPMTTQGDRKDMYVCGDDEESKTWALRLVRQVGYQPVDCGPLLKARFTEPLAIVWIGLAFDPSWGREHAFKLLPNPHPIGSYS